MPTVAAFHPGALNSSFQAGRLEGPLLGCEGFTVYICLRC